MGDEAISLGRILERVEAWRGVDTGEVWLNYWRKQGLQARPETDLFVQVGDGPEAGY